MIDKTLTPRLQIGEKNILQVSKLVDFGAYLVDSVGQEILLPKRYLDDGVEVDDLLEVFAYTDSDDRPVAVTDTPLAMVGQCACLQVVSTTSIGAFLDWGLPKDLLVPTRQQADPMQPGEKYVVYVYLDTHTNRVAASSKLSMYLKEVSDAFYAGEEVDLLIANTTRLGHKAIINKTHLGVLFYSDVHEKLTPGDEKKGFIKNVRAEDGRIDLSLAPIVKKSKFELHDQILHELRINEGVSDITDKSSPALIFEKYGVSKGTYKKALGTLYKDRKISLSKSEVRLNKG